MRIAQSCLNGVNGKGENGYDRVTLLIRSPTALVLTEKRSNSQLGPAGALHPKYHVDHVANTDCDGRAAPSQIKAKAAHTAPPQLTDAGVSWTPAIQPQAEPMKRLLPLVEPLMYPSMVSGPSQFLLRTQGTGL
jgi:hypothetical protein